jgi:hypothetical protein
MHGWQTLNKTARRGLEAPCTAKLPRCKSAVASESVFGVLVVRTLGVGLSKCEVRVQALKAPKSGRPNEVKRVGAAKVTNSKDRRSGLRDSHDVGRDFVAAKRTNRHEISHDAVCAVGGCNASAATAASIDSVQLFCRALLAMLPLDPLLWAHALPFRDCELIVAIQR